MLGRCGGRRVLAARPWAGPTPAREPVVTQVAATAAAAAGRGGVMSPSPSVDSGLGRPGIVTVTVSQVMIRRSLSHGRGINLRVWPPSHWQCT
jgi:hypothetical protein